LAPTFSDFFLPSLILPPMGSALNWRKFLL
jgi:hypothetical protein